MYKISISLAFIMFVQLTGCKTSESTIAVQKVKNYDSSAGNHILFLDFEITKQGKKNKVVKLINVVSGSGKMKNLGAPVHSPYQIRVLQGYSSDRAQTEMVFEHPLYKTVEVAGLDGKLSKHELVEKKGVLSVRIQEDMALEKIELYSVTPEKGNTKIYTLNLKQ